jgi:phosphoglycerate dehydrogenase-like enzyme
MTKVLICSYLEPEHVERIRAVDASLEVIYAPELLPKPRYTADHVGFPLKRTPQEQVRWEALLGEAEILFDFDYTGIKELPERAKRVRWIQASSAGIGQFVRRHGYERMNAVFTTASGVHARPLAEFVLMVMLEHVKQSSLARKQQQERLWKRFATEELTHKTLAIVGLGNIGREVARLAKALEMRVIANKRHPDGKTPQSLGVDQLFAWNELHLMLSEADFVCLITPHTPETEGLMNKAAFAAMKPGAMLVNIARGAVVVEADLLAALDSGHLAHAALDVAAVEPLPPQSPLWMHPKVTIYPHSASTSAFENARLTELFCRNLRRYLDKEPLLNQLDLERMY